MIEKLSEAKTNDEINLGVEILLYRLIQIMKN